MIAMETKHIHQESISNQWEVLQYHVMVYQKALRGGNCSKSRTVSLLDIADSKVLMASDGQLQMIPMEWHAWYALNPMAC